MNVIILGPAGSGKTTLASSFREYLNKNGYSVRIINLDPGVIELPYKPDFDVRSLFTITDIMKKEGLGPNGAMLKAMEIISSIKLPIFNADFTLYDTPGQLEPFIFRRAGRAIAEKLEHTVGIYVLDITAPKHMFPALYLYSIVAQLALGIPIVIVLNKVDLIEDKNITEIARAFIDPQLFMKFLDESVLSDMESEMLKLLPKFTPAQRIPLISAKTGRGLDELTDMLYEVRCVCGDML